MESRDRYPGADLSVHGYQDQGPFLSFYFNIHCFLPYDPNACYGSNYICITTSDNKNLERKHTHRLSLGITYQVIWYNDIPMM
jgi:hypothetical protein